MKEKHIHIFKQVGSGCMLVDTGIKPPCDCEYECFCGVKFKLLTDRVGHRFLPTEFMVEEPNEIKQAELDAIAEADFGIPPTKA